MVAAALTLSLLLEENPRGLVLVRDELAGMLASLNQYKTIGGHDRQWFLEVWGHNLSPRDRKSDKGPPVFLDRPFVSIVGGTQPDVVERFRGEPRRGAPLPADGFLDRWLFSFPFEVQAIGETWPAPCTPRRRDRRSLELYAGGLPLHIPCARKDGKRWKGMPP